MVSQVNPTGAYWPMYKLRNKRYLAVEPKVFSEWGAGGKILW
ncbi:hypothetical protein X474_12305 [Dethiosulfatarculus sandiegensis]|uniref:Uncharacterized protein n=1 Tax=Dethiosulfatarculus sandiegensis TaxID=1429043 RepID=A0A0D2JE79_9BACT|nr:hypothetical protein X474_12305 [Dethiosulfatarculus sandiegensis]